MSPVATYQRRLDERQRANEVRDEQRLEALQRANEVRCGRAELRERIRAGELHVAEVLLRPPPALWTSPIERVLSAAPRLGPAKKQRVLTAARISPTAQLAKLTARQRHLLVDMLRELYPRLWASWKT